MNSNGQPETFRADVGMRIVIDVPTYAAVGGLMDEITAMMHALFRRDGLRAEFDFTHFNTHPCKASQMAHYVEGSEYEIQACQPDHLHLTQH